MNVWPEDDFTELVADKTGGNEKTLQSDYLPMGEYPIVDQGQALIGGYTNDATRLCKAELPVIVFGDHTKCFKFIDFPFCLGADGTKVLRPKKALDERYLFYALQRIHIPDSGYSRHFKYLKEGKIPLPPLDEQKRIAAILDQADELRRKRQRAIDRLNQLGQAIFHEMFGDLLNSENAKASLGDVCDVRDGTHDSPKYVEHGFPLLTSKNFSAGYIDYTGAKFVSRQDYEQINRRSKVDEGDIVMPMIGTIGSPVIVDFEPEFAIKNVALIKFKKREISADFIRQVLDGPLFQRHVASKGRGGTQKFVSLGDIRTFQIPIPTSAQQKEFARRVQTVEAEQSKQQDGLDKFTKLFASLQHSAFQGEL